MNIIESLNNSEKNYGVNWYANYIPWYWSQYRKTRDPNNRIIDLYPL